MAETDTQEQGPWTKYQPPPPSDEEEGPWKKYAAPTAAAASPNVPTRKAGEAKLLTPEEVNKFQPPTKFEQERDPSLQPSPSLWEAANKPLGKDVARGMRESISNLSSKLPEPLRGPAAYAGNLVTAIPTSIAEAGRRMMTTPLGVGTLGAGAGVGAAKTALANWPKIRAGIGAGEAALGTAFAAPGAKEAVTPRQLGETGIQEFERRVGGTGQALLGSTAVGQGATEAGKAYTQARTPARISNFDAVVRDLADKTPADLEFTKTLNKVRPDIAEIARKSGFDEKGNARVGEFQQQLDRRAGEIWDEEHKPQVARHKDMPIDHEAVAQRASSAISKADRANNPTAARAADRWIASALNPDVIGTVGGADDMIRRINAEVPNLPEPFKVIGKTVRNAAVKALRGELEGALESTGEEGVKGPNTRWGALREVSDAIEAKLNSAVNRPISAWETIRNAGRASYHGARDLGLAGAGLGYLGGETALGAEIGGGLGATAGVVGSVAHDVLSQPGGRIARAMRGLGRTNLQPPTVQAPDWVGNRPAGLITEWSGGATPAGNGPDISGTNVPPEQSQVPRTWTAEDINRMARETPNAPPASSVPQTTATGTVQPMALGPGQPGPLYRGPMRPPTVQRFPALPETAGGESIPSTTVKPWQPLLGTPPEAPNVPRNVPRETTVEQKVTEGKKVSEGKPPEGTTERRKSARETEGPDFFRTARMSELRNTAADESVPQEERDLAQRQLDDMKANPFEKHEGADINQVKAMNKPTMTREEAEAKTAERKAGRNARFGEGGGAGGVLPGMEEHVAKQAQGAAKVQGEKLTEEINQPRSVDEAAARMETMSPLFRGTGASPQNEMFRPGGEPVKPMEKPVVPEPEEEATPTEVKGVTAKEPKTAKPKAEKAIPIEKRFSREEITDAEGLLAQEAGMMTGGDRPDVYYDEHTDETRPLTQNQDFRHGERAGGKWRGVSSSRDMMPFMSENPELAPQAVLKALRNKDSAAYARVMEKALEFIRREKMSPEEKAAAGEAKAKGWARLISRKPAMREPGED